tara:strand:- start:356 stop:562 length:207 start_codon:yes stop_codon:yes gene_type:complete
MITNYRKEHSMKVKEAILEEISAYIDGRINELSELARKYAEIDNYTEIARMREMVKVQKMMEKLNNRP